MNKTILANFFYDQCAGTTNGRQPNNPVLFSLISAHRKQSIDAYACTEIEFAQILLEIADTLLENNK
jgi:hypothetical protein